MIDLDRPARHARRTWPWLWWSALMTGLALLAGAAGGVVALAQRADASPAPATHMIEFVIEGEYAAVDHVSVDGAPAETGKALPGERLAIVTVRSHDAAPAACSIVVDGRTVVTERGAYGQAITCVWSAMR